MISNTEKTGAGSAYWVLVDSDGYRIVVGPADHDAAVTGAPVRIAGAYRATVPAVADGNTVDWLMDAAGRGVMLDGSLQEVEALASAVRVASVNSADLTNPGATGAIISVDVTAAPGPAPDVDLGVQLKIPNTAVYVDLFVIAAGITATGQFIYIVHPDWGAAAHDVTEVENIALPKTWRIQMTHQNANSITYSVEVSYLK